MGKVVDVLKAILTRIIFAGHGFVAIWRVTTIKSDPAYWYLSVSLLVLAFEGLFTLTIKANQEWRWFCPSVFLYLSSVVPSIWLLEFDKLDKRLELRDAGLNFTAADYINLTADNINITEELKAIQTFGVEIKIPVNLSSETWATVIEQFLMLILIIGRWLLPKGDLTREQLSQLLLVYIGTAADIIEFFDSFKDDKVAYNRVLCILILSIWSWSLLQFTLVLTSSDKSKKKPKVRVKGAAEHQHNCCHTARKVCCSIDVWSILINIILQDAPFFTFRLLLILYYKIISYMNIFFTCKNTLVIILQFYRLLVVQSDKRKALQARRKGVEPNRGVSPANNNRRRPASQPVETSRSVRGTRVVKSPRSTVKSPNKSPRKAVGKLVRTVSEDDGGTVYSGPQDTFLLHAENETSWRQYSRGRRRSLSTGDLSVTAEMLSIEMDSSPDRSVYSADLGASGCDPEAGEEVESDFEAERLSNLAEEQDDDDDGGDANEAPDSQHSASPEVEYAREKEPAFDRKAKMNRYASVDQQARQARTSASQRPVPMPRKTAGNNVPVTLPSARSPTSRSVASRSSNQGSREKKRTPRQDTGYSTASSASKDSPGNGKRGDSGARATTPNRERRETRRARPRDLGRPISSQELDDIYELNSPARSSRNKQRPARKSTTSNGRREASLDFDETDEWEASGGDDHAGAIESKLA